VKWADHRWRSARWLRRTAMFECAIALVALVLLTVFAASGRDTISLVVPACVAVLASSLAVLFGLRARALDRATTSRR
jgi:peptidoglycan/LPS O-acetylase OafA/YrhL